MVQVIKQSAAITVPLGPFVDATDGFTAETALTITQPDIRLSKNGGAFAQVSDAQTLSHMENGYYSLSLSATDTGTAGRLTVHVNESGARPVLREFQVMAGAAYDLLYASGADPVTALVAAGKDLDRRGTAQGAGSGSNTLVLAVADLKADDFYNGAFIVLLEGGGTPGWTAAERTRRITDYANATNQVTVDANWADPPDATSVYLIVGG